MPDYDWIDEVMAGQNRMLDELVALIEADHQAALAEGRRWAERMKEEADEEDEEEEEMTDAQKHRPHRDKVETMSRATRDMWIVRLSNQGLSSAQIGKKLNMTRQGVDSAIRRIASEGTEDSYWSEWGGERADPEEAW